MYDFKSNFASDLSGMIQLKVSLGGSASTYLPRATAFDAFCIGKHRDAGTLLCIGFIFVVGLCVAMLYFL